MQIRLYDDTQKLPGGSVYSLSEVILSEEMIETEIALELKAFLSALLSINLGVIAHLTIERELNFGGGEAVRMAITSEISEDSEFLLIWQRGYESSSGAHVVLNWIHLDIDPLLVAEEFQEKYVSKVKSKEEWVAYFLALFEELCNEKKMQIARSKEYIECLSAPKNRQRESYTGQYANFVKKICIE